MKTDPSIHGISLSCIARDDNFLFSADDNGKIAKWDANNLSLLKSIEITGALFHSIYCDADYLYVGSSYLDNRIRVFEKCNLDLVETIEAHTSSVTSITGLDDILISSSADAVIKKWRKGSWDCLETYQSDQNILLCVSISANHRLIFAGGIGAKIEVISLDELNLNTELKGTNASIFSLVNYENRLYSGSGEIWWGGPGSPRPPEFESAIRVWDTVTWDCLQILEGHTDNINGLAISDNWLVSASDDGSLRIYDTESNKQLICLDIDKIAIKGILSDSENVYIALRTGSIWKIPLDVIHDLLG